MRAAEIMRDLIRRAVALFDADDRDWHARDRADAADDRLIVGKAAISVQFDEILHDTADVFHRGGSALFAAFEHFFVCVHSIPPPRAGVKVPPTFLSSLCAPR